MTFRIKYIVFALFACLWQVQGYAQAPPLFGWQKCLGGTSIDASQKIIPCINGEMLVIGNTQSTNGDILSNHGSRDFWIMRLDANGLLIWARTFGGSGSDVATSAVELANGNIVATGYSSSSNGDVTGNHGNFDIWLICLDAAGNLRWQKALGGTNNDFAESIAATADGGFALGGSSYSNNGDASGNHGDQDFWIVKTDSTGNLLWQRSIRETAFEQCFTIATLADGTLAAAGVSASNNGNVSGNNGQNDCIVVRLDANGTILWTRLFGGSSMESAFHCIQNAAGNLVLAGYTNSSDSDIAVNRGSSDVWLLELDLAGTLQNSQTFGGSYSDIAYSIAENAGGYLLASSTFSLDMDVPVNHGGEDVLLIQTDLNGNKIWTKTYGGSGGDHPASFIGDYNDGFRLCGYTSSNNGDVSGNHGNSDVWVCSLSCLAPSMAFTNPVDSLCIYSTAAFSSNSVNASVYVWKVNGLPVSTAANISYTFNAAGSYLVELVGSTCMMTDTFSKNILASPVPNPVITASSTLICNNDSVLLQATSADNYSWSNGATGQTIRIGAGGTYNVVATTAGCAGMSLPISITSHTIPTFSLGNDTAFCSGSSFWITAPAGYSSYTWHDGSPYRSFIATQPGLYYVTVGDGVCDLTDSIEVDTVNCSLLVANFNANRTVICQDEAVDFLDLSMNAVSWQWNFPGGTPSSSTQQNPSGIVYGTSGHYDVDLIVSNANGSTASYRQGYITVNALPVKPTFYATGPVLIASQAYSYQWFLGNVPVNGATGQAFTAAQTGNYSVQVFTQAGCSSMSDPQVVLVTGISEAGQDVFSVYPNPARNKIFIRFAGSGTATVEVLNIAGQRVLVSEFSIQGKEHVMDLEFLEQGFYFVKAVQGDSMYVTRIQVIR